MQCCKEPRADNRVFFCIAAGLWRQQQQISCYQPALNGCQKAQWAGSSRQVLRGQNLSAETHLQLDNKLCCFRPSLAFTCEQLFKLMSQVGLFFFFFPSVRCQIIQKRIMKCIKPQNVTKAGNEWVHGEISGGNETQLTGVMNGAESLSDTSKLRAICCKLQVRSGELWFSLDNKEIWTNGITWRQTKMQKLFLSPLLQPILHEFNMCFLSPQTQRDASQWTICRAKSRGPLGFKIRPFRLYPSGLTSQKLLSKNQQTLTFYWRTCKILT